MREMKENNVQSILIASNAEQSYVDSLVQSAKAYNVPYEVGDSMEAISARFDIDVPSGAVGVLKK